MREIYIRETHITDGGASINNDTLLKQRPNKDGLFQSVMDFYGAGRMNISSLPPPHMVGPTGPIAKPNYFDSYTQRIHKPESKIKKASNSKSHYRPFELVSHRVPQPTHASPTQISGGNPIVSVKSSQKESPHMESSHSIPLEIESIPSHSDASHSDDNLQTLQPVTLRAVQPDAQACGLSEEVPAEKVAGAVSVGTCEDLSSFDTGLTDELPASPASQPASHHPHDHPNIIDQVFTINIANGLPLEEVQQRMASSHPDYKYLEEESFLKPLERVLESQKHFIAINSTEVGGKVWHRLHYYDGTKLNENANSPIFASKKDYLSIENVSRERIPEFEVTAMDLTASDVVSGAFLARPNPVALSIVDICRVITLLYGDLPFPDLETEIEHVLRSSAKFTAILMCGSKRYILNDFYIRSSPLRRMILQEQLKMRILNGDHEIISKNSFFYPKYTKAQLEITDNVESQTFPSNVQTNEDELATTGESVPQQSIESPISQKCGINQALNTSSTISEVPNLSKDKLSVNESKANETTNEMDAMNKTNAGSKVSKENNEEDMDSTDETSDEESSNYELDDEETSADESTYEEEEEEEEEPKSGKRLQRKSRQRANMNGKRLNESDNARFERWKARIMYRSEKASVRKTGRRRT